MVNIISVNIPGFGDRFCSDDVEWKITHGGDRYTFYKKGTSIKHNEYGPAIEWKHGSYEYCVNNKLHNVIGPAVYDASIGMYYYYVDHKFIQRTNALNNINIKLKITTTDVLKDNKEESEEEKYSRILTSVPKGNCPCGIYKSECDYHKDG